LIVPPCFYFMLLVINILDNLVLALPFFTIQSGCFNTN
jgi:hypothetical protein